MHIDPQLAIAAVTTLAAGWLMMGAAVEKHALERKRRRRICPSCGTEITARVCASCTS